VRLFAILNFVGCLLPHAQQVAVEEAQAASDDRCRAISSPNTCSRTPLKIYDDGSWRSAEHVHLSTGCESMNHMAMTRAVHTILSAKGNAGPNAVTRNAVER
jgi:hypothetical protein